MKNKLVLYAPNVHTGGGLVLLQSLLTNWNQDDIELVATLDSRARGVLMLSEGVSVKWVEATPASRLNAEFDLYLQGRKGDVVVLCFHGLPPIFPNRGKIIVFQQNRNYLGLNPQKNFSWRTRLRLILERLIAKLFRHRVSIYIVQSPSMKRELIAWYRRGLRSDYSPNVHLMPFMADQISTSERKGADSKFDFIYVADGEAHKNHRMLLRAWALLAEEGFRPTLALTLTSRDSNLRKEVELAAGKNNLRVTDLGHLPHNSVLALYKNAKALIFPSTSESLGLPLIEASRMGLPILAGELDFVRDVCTPCETFDTGSHVSIARAVKRFLGCCESPISPCSPTMFWNEFLFLSHSKSDEIASS
jgi:glycosyltransferase involved in cell wall biosynthesis